ncbi:MAG: phosphoribosylamine--glycine ligase [Candidatus Omnitrophica bacterium]|nr:phosphoribosylamine--glycine ligase [Candidatus Omnitrophota bacterium]
MNILVVGSGGREHALCWKIRQSPRVKKLYCAPGNGGIESIAECVDIKAYDIVALADFAHAHAIDLTVVGPEVPLVEGIVDLFEEEELKIFGPTKAAARLEGSKVFAKSFMKRWEIPTARYAAFTDLSAAIAGLKNFTMPVVVKADGLAAGKGVIIAQTSASAEAALNSIMADRVFKEAGKRVVIEEFLTGEEASVLVVSDGKDFVLLESSQDHKRVFDNDEGPNTGGMGAYSPAPVVTPDLLKEIAATIIRPVLDGMADEEAPFRGILYCGIMVTPEGPKVLEFNTRFGDPETQAVLPRLKSDIVELMLAATEGRLKDFSLKWDSRACVCVVLAAGGYPGEFATGQQILGLSDVPAEAMVFHAGTRKEGGKILTAGGRVLGVTALGAGIEEAISKVYAAAGQVVFEGRHCRQDIGRKALGR